MLARRHRAVFAAAAVVLLLGGAVAVSAQEASRQVNEIRFRITDVRGSEGRMACGIYSQKGWLKEGQPGAGGHIRDGESVCVFRNVPPGRYGVAAYHDENGNRKLDTNFMRVPKEGICASNDARGVFGPPRFKRASFDYEGGVLELEARLRY